MKHVESLTEELEVITLRSRLQGVTNGMLALTTPDLTSEEKLISMQALQQEEGTLRQLLGDRLSCAGSVRSRTIDSERTSIVSIFSQSQDGLSDGRPEGEPRPRCRQSPRSP